MWDDWPNLLSDILRYGFIMRAHILDFMMGRGFKLTPEPGVRHKHAKNIKRRWYFYLTLVYGTYSCYYCKQPFSKYLMPSIDHKEPLAKGGVDHFSNYVMACEWCNRRKGCKAEYDTELAQKRAHNRYWASRRKKYKSKN
jgi:hypothetical protein